MKVRVKLYWRWGLSLSLSLGQQLTEAELLPPGARPEGVRQAAVPGVGVGRVVGGGGGGGGAGGGAVTGRGLALVTALVRDHRHAPAPLLPPRRALLALGPAREPAQVPLHHLAPLRVALLHLVVVEGGPAPAPALVTVRPGLEVGDEGADPDAPLHEVVL